MLDLQCLSIFRLSLCAVRVLTPLAISTHRTLHVSDRSVASRLVCAHVRCFVRCAALGVAKEELVTRGPRYQ